MVATYWILATGLKREYEIDTKKGGEVATYWILATGLKLLIIGIKNRTAQTVVLSRDELLIYWKMWVKRVERYYSMQANKSLEYLEVA